MVPIKIFLLTLLVLSCWSEISPDEDEEDAPMLITRAERRRLQAIRKQLQKIAQQRKYEARHDGIAEEALKRLAQKLGSELYRLTKDASGYSQVEQGFREAGVRVEKQDVAARLQEMASKMAGSFRKKVEAVKRLVDNAEEVTQDPQFNVWDPELKYFNAKQFDNIQNDSLFLPMEFMRDPRYYNDEVNLINSSVHVPTNIYNRSPMVLQGVRWSKMLDTMFRTNQERDDTLKYQYFGSAEGFMRMFPGTRWTVEAGKPDMYDCRLTNWYIRAASSPKDMVILLDNSGSMTGVRQEIARTTVKEIMNTLHEDDYFNIIKIMDPAEFLDPCVADTLVQASELTKSFFEEKVKGLKPGRIANFSEALTMAFHVLNANRSDQLPGQARESAGCNKAIMIISDGAPEEFEELLAELNPERKVRIFAYVIGREVTDTSAMKRIACRNRGFVTHVSTMADVRDNVEDYYRVLGRPMVLWRNHTNIWTNAYWHPKTQISVFSRPVGMLPGAFKEGATWTARYQTTDHSGSPNSGMVISVAQPVFNRSQAAAKKGSLIGVMGIDINVTDIKAMLTPYRWGAGSYVFGTNHNGHVMFHPYWKGIVKQTAVPKYSYSEIDLSEVEFPTHKDQPHNDMQERSFSLPLRTDMINQRTGQQTMLILRQLDRRTRVYVREYTYSYTGVLDTPLSVGIAVPVRMGRPNSDLLRVVGRTPWADFQRHNIDPNTTEWRLHPEWAYCNATVHDVHHLMEILKKNATEKPTDPVDGVEGVGSVSPIICDAELVESLLTDILATEKAAQQWVAPGPRGQFGVPIEIETVFVATRAGLTRYKDVPPLPLDRVQPPSGELGTVEYLRVERSDNGPTEPAPTAGNGTEAPAPEEKKRMTHFFELHNKSVEESFYERTVSSASDLTITTSLSIREPADRRTEPETELDPNESSVMAAVPVYVPSQPPSQQLAPAAITGIIIKRRTIKNLLLHLSTETCLFGGTGKPSASASSSCRSCHHPAVSCYLIDESGYVVVSTRQQDDSGRFFGMLHGEVMMELVKRNISQRYKLYDYQGMCNKGQNKAAGSGGSILRSLFGGLLHAGRLLLGQVVVFLYTILKSVVPAAGDETRAEEIHYQYWYKDDPCKWSPALKEGEGWADKVDPDGSDEDDNATLLAAGPPPRCVREQPKPPPVHYVPCDMEYYLYHIEWTQVKSTFTFSCLTNCTKTVGVFKVSTSNLLLVAMDKPLSCACNDTQLTTTAVPLSYEREVPAADSDEAETETPTTMSPETHLLAARRCLKYNQRPYRRKPADCYYYHPDEDSSDCGLGGMDLSGSVRAVCRWPMVLAILVIVVVDRLS